MTDTTSHAEHTGLREDVTQKRQRSDEEEGTVLGGGVSAGNFHAACVPLCREALLLVLVPAVWVTLHGWVRVLAQGCWEARPHQAKVSPRTEPQPHANLSRKAPQGDRLLGGSSSIRISWQADPGLSGITTM